MNSISIFAVDAGSQPCFAWANHAGESGKDGATLVDAILQAITANQRIALGFECPLFIPVPQDWSGIGKARLGENTHPWSAGAGATVTAYGLHELAWVLLRLREKLSQPQRLYFAPEPWLESLEPGLLLWEAFVSGKDKGNDHLADAKLACTAFAELLPHGNWEQARQVCVAGGADAFNLAAAAGEWAGWHVDPAERKSQLLVVKPRSSVENT